MTPSLVPWWTWTALLVPGLAAFAALFPRIPRAARGPAVASGAFLVVLDLAVENAGWHLGLWSADGALVSVGVTPVEVLVLAFLAGACLAAFLDVWPRGPASGLALLAAGGAAVEAGLVHLGMMTYHAPWGPVWAFAAYLGALSATLGVHRWAAQRLERPAAVPAQG